MTAETSSPKISVIIPCFNARPYIGDAIESVFAQKYPNIEVLVIDDGSTDGSADVINAAAHNVLYFRQPNKGISEARNEGIKKAGGDLIAFLDADDLWPSGSLSARLSLLRNDEGIDAAYGATRQFISPDVDSSKANTIHCPENPIVARVAGAILMRRSAYLRTGPFNSELSMGETMDWVARSEAAGVKYASTDSIVLMRRIHESNTVIKERHQQTDYLKVLRAAIHRKRAVNQ